MIYTDFNGKLVSKLGMGTLHLPTKNGRADTYETTRIVDLLMEKGVTYYDLGHSYLGGEAEKALKEALVMRYPRERYYLSSKLHIKDLGGSAQSLFEKQLEACGVSYFDFYLVHGITDELWESIEEKMIFPLLRGKKEEGKIDAAGASFHTSFELFEYILNKYDDIIEFVQLPLSYFDMARSDVRKQYELARERNIPVIAMSPLKGGKLSQQANNRADAGASYVRKKYSADLYDLGLLYASSLDGVICVLSGISSSKQARRNASLMEKEIKLTEKELKLVESSAWDFSDEDDNRILCLGCSYCDKCPSKIKIPRIFEIYNELSRGCNEQLFGLKQAVKKEKLIQSECRGCKKCEEVCPQHLSIVSFIERLGYRKNEREDYTADS